MHTKRVEMKPKKRRQTKKKQKKITRKTNAQQQKKMNALQEEENDARTNRVNIFFSYFHGFAHACVKQTRREKKLTMFTFAITHTHTWKSVGYGSKDRVIVYTKVSQ